MCIIVTITTLSTFITRTRVQEGETEYYEYSTNIIITIDIIMGIFIVNITIFITRTRVQEGETDAVSNLGIKPKIEKPIHM